MHNSIIIIKTTVNGIEDFAILVVFLHIISIIIAIFNKVLNKYTLKYKFYCIVLTVKIGASLLLEIMMTVKKPKKHHCIKTILALFATLKI